MAYRPPLFADPGSLTCSWLLLAGIKEFLGIIALLMLIEDMEILM